MTSCLNCNWWTLVHHPVPNTALGFFNGKRHRRRSTMLGSDKAILGSLGLLVLGIVVALLVS